MDYTLSKHAMKVIANRFISLTWIDSDEIKKDVIVDYNVEDEIVSVEVLNVKTNPHEIDIPTILKSA